MAGLHHIQGAKSSPAPNGLRQEAAARPIARRERSGAVSARRCALESWRLGSVKRHAASYRAGFFLAVSYPSDHARASAGSVARWGFSRLGIRESQAVKPPSQARLRARLQGKGLKTRPRHDPPWNPNTRRQRGPKLIERREQFRDGEGWRFGFFPL